MYPKNDVDYTKRLPPRNIHVFCDIKTFMILQLVAVRFQLIYVMGVICSYWNRLMAIDETSTRSAADRAARKWMMEIDQKCSCKVLSQVCDVYENIANAHIIINNNVTSRHLENDLETRAAANSRLAIL